MNRHRKVRKNRLQRPAIDDLSRKILIANRGEIANLRLAPRRRELDYPQPGVFCRKTKPSPCMCARPAIKP